MDFRGNYHGHRDFIEYSFDSVSLSDSLEDGLKLIHIHNYNTSPESVKNKIFVPGKSFLAPAASQYYHTLVDIIGTYEYIRSIDPEVNIVFCAKDTNDGDNGQFFRESNNPNNLFVLEVQKMYNSSGIIFDIINDSVEFEEVVFMPTRSMWDYDRMTPFSIQEELFDFSHEELIPVRFKYIEKIIEKFLPMRSESKLKKIYSSRMPYDKNDPDFIHFDNSYFDNKESDRVYDEREIIKYFRSNGYEIVNMWSMNLLDQFSLMSQATHFSGMDGSNMFPGVYMSPGSNVNIISTQNFWGYEFTKYLKSRELNVNEICFAESSAMPKTKGMHLDKDFVLNSIINDAVI
jgi:hypothetical protein